MQERKSSKSFRIKKVSIVGVIPSFAFQRAKFCALELHRKLPLKFPQPEIVGLLELDWNEKLTEWRQAFGREYWCLRRPVAVFFDDKFIGSDIELIKLTTIGNIILENVPRKNMGFIKDNFRKDYISYLKKTKRIYCYLDICIDDVYVGTLTFQLYSDLVPKTCENFKSLCLGSRGPLLSYKGSRIHRIVKEGWLQGGDIQYKTGGGGFSIFCDPLEDECFGISHDRRGVLSMANYGPHTNGSQFFITLKPSKWMDTHYVAFGQLIEGVNVLKTLEKLDTFYECPLRKIEIKNCGKLDLEDVEDVDAMYREVPYPKKKPKKIETISEQIVRLVMEALTSALARKEHIPDILDDRDIPSKMDLQLYFQGFYSIPERILEEAAQYLRSLRRQLLRDVKPSATEVVEVLMYDLLMAVLTRMTTLDDVRETIGHEMYQKMIGGINMQLELCQKPYVKKMIDQIVTTAESMVDFINKKLLRMKRTSVNLKNFQDYMQNWVQSFVLQETFVGDRYHIAARPGWDDLVEKITGKKKVKTPEKKKETPEREGIPCCEKERKEKEALEKEKLKKIPPEDICCLGSKIFNISEIKLSDYFSTCRYGLKRFPRNDEERMPLLDLIEISRYQLRWMRKQENRERPKDRLCTEKKLNRWLAEVIYIPETSWLKDLVFDKEDEVFEHKEEIMYGAMTAGLLEMYYFYEQYLKLCGGKKQKLVTRTIYPEDSEETLKETKPEQAEEQASEGSASVQGEQPEEEPKVNVCPCTCGHPCCVCPFDPHCQPPTPPPSLEEEEEEGESEYEEPIKPVEPKPEPFTCPSDMTLVDLNAILAEKVSLSPEEIDIRSFKWLRSYILEKGCDLKTEFATQVHKWLEGERFNYNGFISKHSLVTRASLLSLSMSLAELLKEDNKMKTDIRNLVYDLWDLYFAEMFKEALLEFPPDEEDVFEEEPGEEEDKEEKEMKEGANDMDDECKKIIAEIPEFDFDSYCAKAGHELKRYDEVKVESEKVPKTEPEEYEPMPASEPIEQFEPIQPPKPRQTSESAQPPKPRQTSESAQSSKPRQASESAQTSKRRHLSESIEPPPPSPPVDENQEPQEPSWPKDETSEIRMMSDHSITQPKEEINVDQEGIEEIKKVKKRKSPIIIEELVDDSSGDEAREMPPYVLPFWVKFLTELTKQALGALAKVSRLPRRLYFLSDSVMNFDDKMKEWFEFNAFNPQPTKGREIMDFIAVHHKSLTNLEDTARSYLKKKKYTELINRCSRITSAEDMAEEIVTDVLQNAMNQTEETETLELFVSNLISCAITSSPNRSELDYEDDEENTYETDQRDSVESYREEED